MVGIDYSNMKDDHQFQHLFKILKKLDANTATALERIQKGHVPLVIDLESTIVPSAKLEAEGLPLEYFPAKGNILHYVNSPDLIRALNYNGILNGSFVDLYRIGRINGFFVATEDGKVPDSGINIHKIIADQNHFYIESTADWPNLSRAVVFHMPIEFKLNHQAANENTFIFGWTAENIFNTYGNCNRTIHLRDQDMGKYIIQRGKATSGWFAPNLDPKYKLFRCNIFIFKDGLYLPYADLEAKGNNLFRIVGYAENRVYDYVALYWKEAESIDNLNLISNYVEIIGEIINNSDLYRNYISKIEEDFDYKFEANLNFNQNMEKFMRYIISYNRNLLNEVYEHQATTYSVCITGREMIDRAVGGFYSIPSRIPNTNYESGYNNGIIVFVNGKLFSGYSSIKNNGVTYKIPTGELLFDDQIEIQYYRNYNNKVYNSTIYRNKEICTNAVSEDIDDTLFFSNDPNISELYDFAQMTQYKPVKARYVRYSCKGNNIDNTNMWVHIKVINKEQQNLSFNKKCYSISGTLIPDYLVLTGKEPERATPTSIDIADWYVDLEEIRTISYTDIKRKSTGLTHQTKYTKTKIYTSEDCIVWTLHYDSDIDGEYYESADYDKSIYFKNNELIPTGNETAKYNLLHDKIVMDKPIRYIREWTRGNNLNMGNHWVELQAFDNDNDNVALNKPVTANFTPATGNVAYARLDELTNNIVSNNKYIMADYDSIRERPAYVQVDLGYVANIQSIKIWHLSTDNRQYKDILLETSIDGNSWITQFDSNINGQYTEVSTGKTHYMKAESFESRQKHYTVKFKANFFNSDNFHKRYSEESIVSARYIRHELESTLSELFVSSWDEFEVYSNNVNVALNKTAKIIDLNNTARVPVNAAYTVDGLFGANTWFDNSYDRCALEIDLGQSYILDYFKIYHCTPFNVFFAKSIIWVSEDGIKWNSVYDSYNTEKDYNSISTGNTIMVPKEKPEELYYYGKPIEMCSNRQFKHYGTNLNNSDSILSKGISMISYKISDSVPTNQYDSYLTAIDLNNNITLTKQTQESIWGYNDNFGYIDNALSWTCTGIYRLSDISTSLTKTVIRWYGFIEIKNPGYYDFAMMGTPSCSLNVAGTTLINKPTATATTYNGDLNTANASSTNVAKGSMWLESGKHSIAITMVGTSSRSAIVVGYKSRVETRYKYLDKTVLKTDGSLNNNFNHQYGLKISLRNYVTNMAAQSEVEFNKALAESTVFANGYTDVETIGYSSDANITEWPVLRKAPSLIVSNSTKLQTNSISQYSGFLYFPIAGEYTFILNSDDGCILEINNTRVASYFGIRTMGYSPFNTLPAVNYHYKYTVDKPGYRSIDLVTYNHLNTNYGLALGWKYGDMTLFEHVPMKNCVPNRPLYNTINLPEEFKYSLNAKQYIVFLNGKRLDYDDYLVHLPALNTPFISPEITITRSTIFNDRIDVFYTPEQNIEIYKREELTKINGTNEYSGFIELDDTSTRSPLNPNHIAVYLNGKKIRKCDIIKISSSSIRIQNNEKCIYNLTIIKQNKFSEMLENMFLLSRDVWSQVVNNSYLKDMIGTYQNITNETENEDVIVSDDPAYLAYHLLYHIFIKNLNRIDAARRFTCRIENLDYKQIYTDAQIKDFTLTVLSHTGTYETIEYLDEYGYQVRGIKTTGLNSSIKISLGDFITPDRYYGLSSISFQVFTLFDINKVRPYISVYDYNNNILDVRFREFKFQTEENIIPKGHWITLHLDNLKFHSNAAKFTVKLDLEGDGKIIEIKKLFFEENKPYPGMNLKVIPIDASKVQNKWLPYNII